MYNIYCHKKVYQVFNRVFRDAIESFGLENPNDYRVTIDESPQLENLILIRKGDDIYKMEVEFIE